MPSTSENPSATETPANTNARVKPTPENPFGYPPFALRFVPTYTNNQLRYYHVTGALLSVDKEELAVKLAERKDALALVNWDGETPDNTPPSSPSRPPTPTSRTLSFQDDGEPDSDCLTVPASYKGIKINPSDIPQLRYNSNVSQFNNWLVALKSAFRGDPAKFPTSTQKIIFASMTLDEQLQTTYNSSSLIHLPITTHWRKYKRWMQDIVLHGDSDRLKLASEFTVARQRVNEDPNQFYLRLMNLGIQSGRTIDVDDYRTRLVRPLLNLLNQHDRHYPTVQDAVAHAGRLWQTLNPEKVQQEIREDRERASRLRRERARQADPKLSDSRTPQRSDTNPQRSENPRGGHRGGPRHSQRPRGRSDRRFDRRQEDRRDRKPRLSAEEQEHRQQERLCFNCGHPGHFSDECEYPFNPNRYIPPKPDESQAKTQSLYSRKRPHSYRPRARTQPVHASDGSDADPDVHTTDNSDDEPDRQRSAKRSKN
jgi:hypothetical protein